MLFSSWIFVAVFLPSAWSVFFFLKNKGRERDALIWLVAASLFFYGAHEPLYILLILTSLTFNYLSARALAKDILLNRQRQALFVSCVCANLAALGYFKYAGLFFQTLNAAGASFTVPNIVLPLAISFFTFQNIAYLVDVYRGQDPEKDFVRYAVFITFFPQLIAGPIVHHKEMMPQLARSLTKRRRRWMLAQGLTVFVMGLFKKVIFADHMGEIADPVFRAAALGAPLSGPEAWVGTLAYTLQIYFDFSGYSDMAIGLAALFGVRLPLNFFAPYRAADIVSFWRRWHITLSRFLRDYLYIPLGGNRQGNVRRLLNVMVTMLLGGLWHGANWTFVLWGGVHGLYLIIAYLWKVHFQIRLPRVAGIVMTFLSVMLAWVLFRADNFSAAIHMYHSLAGSYGWEMNMQGRLLRLNEKWLLMIAALLTVFFAPTVHGVLRGRLALDVTHVAAPYKFRTFVWMPRTGWAISIGFMAAISLLFLYKVNAFIYFKF